MGLMLASLGYGVPLILAALSDVRTFRIPNQLVAAMGLLYLPAAFLSGHAGEIPLHALAAAAVLLAGLPLFALRVLGGGDVKLLSGAALWLGFAGLPQLLLFTALLGGIFALPVLILARFGAGRAKRIPYGVPIAAAGLMLVPILLAS